MESWPQGDFRWYKNQREQKKNLRHYSYLRMKRLRVLQSLWCAASRGRFSCVLRLWKESFLARGIRNQLPTFPCTKVAASGGRASQNIVNIYSQRESKKRGSAIIFRIKNLCELPSYTKPERRRLSTVTEFENPSSERVVIMIPSLRHPDGWWRFNLNSVSIRQ